MPAIVQMCICQVGGKKNWTEIVIRKYTKKILRQIFQTNKKTNTKTTMRTNIQTNTQTNIQTNTKAAYSGNQYMVIHEQHDK
jgi:hypothetical protein